GDDPVARAPHDEGGNVGGQVEAVAGVDTLTAGARDGPDGADERRATVRVREPGDAVDELTALAALVDTDGRQRVLGDLRGAADEPEDDLSAGQRCRADQRADLATQPATRDEHHAL